MLAVEPAAGRRAAAVATCERVLGPGILATYLPSLRVVAVRVLRAGRGEPGEVSG
jgi:hypothetical protein